MHINWSDQTLCSTIINLISTSQAYTIHDDCSKWCFCFREAANTLVPCLTVNLVSTALESWSWLHDLISDTPSEIHTYMLRLIVWYNIYWRALQTQEVSSNYNCHLSLWIWSDFHNVATVTHNILWNWHIPSDSGYNCALSWNLNTGLVHNPSQGPTTIEWTCTLYKK